MSSTIRLSVSRDLPAIAQFEKLLLEGDGWSTNRIDVERNRLGSSSYTSLDGEAVNGYCIFSVCDGVANIKRLLAADSETEVEFLKRLAKKADVHSIQYNVPETWLRQISLLKQVGFTAKKVLRNYFPAIGRDAYQMEINLNH
jgi:hypothetical protein